MKTTKTCCRESLTNLKNMTLDIGPIGRCGECGDLIWIPTGESFPEPFGEPVRMPDGNVWQEVEDGEWIVID